MPNEYALIRMYDAPLAKVWDAWVVAEQVAQWWGPRGFTLTSHQKDVRTGGSWTYVMHGPDGVDYPNKTVFLEVEPRARMLYDHGGNDERPPMFRVDAAFKAVGTNTELAMRMIFASADVATAARKSIQQHNGNSTWDRLAEYLAETHNGKQL
jgi:uncharacterized protein YndB with AHSA1/START domain